MYVIFSTTTQRIIRVLDWDTVEGIQDTHFLHVDIYTNFEKGASFWNPSTWPYIRLLIDANSSL